MLVFVEQIASANRRNDPSDRCKGHSARYHDGENDSQKYEVAVKEISVAVFGRFHEAQSYDFVSDREKASGVLLQLLPK